MAHQRKLGRTADQRKALLRNQVTNLIWYGRIETTEAKAKEVRRIADRMITLAIKECDNNIQTTKETHNDKGQLMTLEVVNDAPSKLYARRLMMAYLYDLKEQKKDDENKKGKILRQERYAGVMQRSFYIGDHLSEEDVKASYESGVLHIKFPKKEALKAPEKKTILIEG